MEPERLKPIIEAALLASPKPLQPAQLAELFAAEERPSADAIAQALHGLAEDCQGRGIELVQVASGFRYQVRTEVFPHLDALWTERPSRYSRALLETLALMAYRQPITRGEIEQIRGVSVATSILRTLEERDWIRVVGHRDVPGKPALYGTTRAFLDYFSLRSLDELPPLSALRDLDALEPQLDLDSSERPARRTAPAPRRDRTAARRGQAVPNRKPAQRSRRVPPRAGTDAAADRRQPPGRYRYRRCRQPTQPASDGPGNPCQRCRTPAATGASPISDPDHAGQRPDPDTTVDPSTATETRHHDNERKVLSCAAATATCRRSPNACTRSWPMPGWARAGRWRSASPPAKCASMARSPSSAPAQQRRPRELDNRRFAAVPCAPEETRC